MDRRTLSKTALPKKLRGKRANKGQRNKMGGGTRGGPSALAGTADEGKSTQIFESWMPIFPAWTVKKLRYSTTFSLTSTLGVVSSYVFRANDLYDPDFTGTGHQPMGFDQMMLWYNHFTVLSSKLVVTCKNSAFTTPAVSLRVDGDSSAITVIDRIVELGGCVMNTLGQTGSSALTCKLSLDVDIAKLQGISRVALTADPDLRGNAAAGPLENTYYHIQTWNTAGTTSTIQFDVIIEYLAHFAEPRDQTQSLAHRDHKVSVPLPPPTETKVEEGFVCICTHK